MPRFEGDNGIWIFLYLIIAIILGLLARPTILSFWRTYTRQAIIILSGFVVLLIGAVGLEIIGYQYLQGPEQTFLYSVEVALEEFFEMAGVSIMLYGTILCAIRNTEHI